MTRPGVLVHVQHLLGIGHLKRAAAISRALVEAGARVTVASGGVAEPRVDFAGAEVVQLPPAVAADAAFSAVLDAAGAPIDAAWKAARTRQLLGLFDRVAPDILLIEMYPFGRRQFRFELLPLLEHARAGARPPLVACSVRDVLIARSKPERSLESAALVRRHFDLVLVHGDPRLIAFGTTFPAAESIADRLHYTGYVTDLALSAAAPDRRKDGEVLVSAGGGAVGMPLLTAAIAAKSRSSLAGRPWRIIAGNNLPAADYARLAAAAAPDPGLTLERFRPDFAKLLQNCHISVSQGGYNTVMELIATRTPAVVVPFAEGQESEQSLRAGLLAEKGVLEVLAPDGLTPAALAAAIDRAAAKGPAAIEIDLDGARKSAALLLRALAERSPG